MQVREGPIPLKTICTAASTLTPAERLAQKNAARTEKPTPGQQQYPLGPAKQGGRAVNFGPPSPNKVSQNTGSPLKTRKKDEEQMRTGVQFKRAPKNMANAFGQRKPTSKHTDTYKSLINQASNAGGEQVTTMEAFIVIAKQLFSVLDADCSGTINLGELSLGMQHIWAELGQQSLMATPERCNEEAAKMLDQFGDADGEVRFINFLRILLLDPWRNLLPKSVAEKANFNIMRMMEIKPPATALTETLRKIETLFDDVDTDGDGFVTYDEFEVLMYAVWEEVGVSPANKEHLHERAARRVFGSDEHFGDVTGMAIHKDAFILIMTDSPWVNQLPRNIRDEMMLEGMRRKAEADQNDIKTNALSIQSLEEQEPPSKGRRPTKWLHSRTVGDLKTDKYKGPRAARRSVMVFPNDGGKQKKGAKVLVYSFDSLLHDSTVALDTGVTKSMTRVFTLNGKELKSLSQVIDNMKLVVSPWGDFKTRGGSVLSAVAKKRFNKNSPAPNRRSNSPYMPCNRSSPKKSVSYSGQPPNKDEAFLEALKCSPATVGEPVLDSILSKMRQYYLPEAN